MDRGVGYSPWSCEQSFTIEQIAQTQLENSIKINQK